MKVYLIFAKIVNLLWQFFDSLLMIWQNDIVLPMLDEELNCYLWEWEFVKRIENPEPWLQKHIIKCISIYSDKK